MSKIKILITTNQMVQQKNLKKIFFNFMDRYNEQYIKIYLINTIYEFEDTFREKLFIINALITNSVVFLSFTQQKKYVKCEIHTFS